MAINPIELATCERESEIFKALSHPTRLWIVKQLASTEQCVCVFVEAVGNDFSTISKHLLVLKKAGIIQDERRGKSIYYSLACPCILNMLACITNR